MQILIEIDEKDKQYLDKCLKGKGLTFFDNAQLIKRIILAVFYGKVLPTGHGDLVDADAVLEQLDDAEKNMPVDHFEGLETAKVVVKSDTPTIIEADRSEE